MHADGFEYNLDEFPPVFDGIQPMCKEVRGILFPLTRSAKLNLSTPPDPLTLDGPIIEASNAATANIAAGKS
jgi:hypothetical protein